MRKSEAGTEKNSFCVKPGNGKFDKSQDDNEDFEID